MTTLEVEIALMNHFDIRRNLIVPNITDWSALNIRFETDLLVLSKSNYATGIEIKVSKSDLKNDLKKKQWRIDNHFNRTHFFKPFKYFYYAVPDYLKDEALKQIPEWCGLITVYNGDYETEITRNPQLLNKNKWTEQQRYQLARLGAMRILSLKTKIQNHSFA